jgi:hypothetical protein
VKRDIREAHLFARTKKFLQSEGISQRDFAIRPTPNRTPLSDEQEFALQRCCTAKYLLS